MEGEKEGGMTIRMMYLGLLVDQAYFPFLSDICTTYRVNNRGFSSGRILESCTGTVHDSDGVRTIGKAS